MGNAHAAERVGRRRFLAMTAACGTLALLASERPAEAADAVVDARQLGARGDGSTDDTRAINAAIDRASANGGGSVVLPAGTYVVGSDDYIHLKSGVSLRGSGIDTVIVAAAGRAPHQLVAEGQPSADITIEGIVFDGRGAAVSLIRLIRPGSRGITIRNCQLRNIGPGKDHFGIVVGASVTSVTIQSNQFANQGNVQGVGISCFGGVANLTIADNTFDGLYGCVRLDAFSGGTRDVNVTGNLMRTWRKWGVLVEGSDRVDVSRNRLENCVGDASDAPFGISA